jgi:hypothetical protein
MSRAARRLRRRQKTLDLNTLGGVVDGIGVVALAQPLDPEPARWLAAAMEVPQRDAERMIARYRRDMLDDPHPEPLRRYIDAVCEVQQGLVEVWSEQWGPPEKVDDRLVFVTRGGVR